MVRQSVDRSVALSIYWSVSPSLVGCRILAGRSVGWPDQSVRLLPAVVCRQVGRSVGEPVGQCRSIGRSVDLVDWSVVGRLWFRHRSIS